MLDVDLFKRINDQFGHGAGDMVLQRLALLAQAVFQGRTDVVARWGGEEFLVLMPETTQAQAYTMVMRLRAQILGTDWSDIHPDLQVTVSVGVAEHGRQAEVTSTLVEADRALYEAKHGGRNLVCTAQPMSEGDLKHSEREQASWPKPYRVDLPQREDKLAQTMAAVLEAKPARSPKSVGSPWSRWLFGTDPFQRAYLKLSLFGIANYLAVCFVLGWDMIPRGMVSESLGRFLQGYCLIGATVPFALIRSGVTRNWRQPEFLGPQLLWACAGLVMGYMAIPDARPFVLQLICVMLVFGFAQLSSRDAIQVGVGVLAMLVAAVGGLHWVWPDPQGSALVWMQLSCTAFIVAMLSVQSHGFALAREALQREKQEVLQATEQVRYLLMHDGLTGLFNRQNAQQILMREQERQERSGQGFCVALIDLDHFKRINDTLGHGVGDEVLQGFASLMSSMLRTTDVISRWGGEEFLLVLTETSQPEQGELVMSRLRQRLAETRLAKAAPELVVTFSAGLVVSRVGEPIATLLERADQALYQAKAQGRDRCVRELAASQALEEASPA
jgi:diguanylate cyclase